VLHDMQCAPSARVLATAVKDFGGSYVAFTRAQSAQTRQALLGLAFPPELAARFEAMAEASEAERRRIEEADTLPFEAYRQAYLSIDRLGV
jgi:glutamate--cysteine ligase